MNRRTPPPPPQSPRKVIIQDSGCRDHQVEGVGGVRHYPALTDITSHGATGA